MIDTNSYSLIIFPDANVILEGRAVPHLPWSTLGEGSILILVTRTVMREIDSRKGDGRLQEAAREFRRLIAPAIGGNVVRISKANGGIDLGFAPGERIPRDYAELHDLSISDIRIVAEILHCTVSLERALFVSRDLGPCNEASLSGLKVKHLSDAPPWGMPAEPHPKDKEIQRLKARKNEEIQVLRDRVAQLERRAPALDIDLSFVDCNEPITVYHVKELLPLEQEQLVELLVAKHTAPDLSQMSVLERSLAQAPVERLDYAGFKDSVAPAFAAGIAARLQEQYGQLVFTLRIANESPYAAEQLTVALGVEEGWINDRPILVDIAPSPREVGSATWASLTSHVARADVGARDMVREHSHERSREIIWTCEHFEQGRQWEFVGFAYFDPRERPFQLRVRVTARNIEGIIECASEANIAVQRAEVSTLIDIEQGCARIDMPFAKQIEEGLLRGEYPDYDAIGWE